MDLQTQVNALIEAARDGEEDDQIRPRQSAVLEVWETADADARTEAVAAISKAIADPEIDPGSGAVLAITGGALVEGGADTSSIGRALLERIPSILTMAQRFQEGKACTIENAISIV